VNLVSQWQKGEVAAFEALFHRYREMVLRTALSMVYIEGEAEDIVQATFVRAYESKDKFKGDEDAFRRWLYRVTINLCLDVYRKRRANLRLEQMKERGFEPSAESARSSQETSDIMWRAMDCLDGKHRSIVVLRYLHEMSYEEIARTLNIPLGTVKSRLSAAIRTMRRKLAEEEA
jgi:RNA polymerase sigma-70 factor (ECF subfamily)